MDDIVKLKPARGPAVAKPSREEAEAAVKTLLAWAGDDPEREGLIDTPRRVVKAYEELFGGYRERPGEVLSRVFNEVEGYSDIVIVQGYSFLLALRAPHRPVLRQGACRLLPARRRGGSVEARAHRGDLRPTVADAGSDDGPDRQCDRKGPDVRAASPC